MSEEQITEGTAEMGTPPVPARLEWAEFRPEETRGRAFEIDVSGAVDHSPARRLLGKTGADALRGAVLVYAGSPHFAACMLSASGTEYRLDGVSAGGGAPGRPDTVLVGWPSAQTGGGSKEWALHEDPLVWSESWQGGAARGGVRDLLTAVSRAWTRPDVKGRALRLPLDSACRLVLAVNLWRVSREAVHLVQAELSGDPGAQEAAWAAYGLPAWAVPGMLGQGNAGLAYPADLLVQSAMGEGLIRAVAGAPAGVSSGGVVRPAARNRPERLDHAELRCRPKEGGAGGDLVCVTWTYAAGQVTLTETAFYSRASAQEWLRSSSQEPGTVRRVWTSPVLGMEDTWAGQQAARMQELTTLVRARIRRGA